MEEVKVSELPVAQTAENEDTVMIVQNGINKQASVEKVSRVAVSPTEPANAKVWFKTGKNLLNKNALVRGNILSANPTAEKLNDDMNAYTTEWIPCLPNKQYTISGGNRNRWQVKSATGVITYSDAATITTPSDARCLRCYCYLNDDSAGITNANLQLEQNLSATTYEAYIDREIYNENGSSEFDIFYKSKTNDNYFTGETIIGTWVDGKPLYRKVLQFTISIDSNNYGTYTGAANLIKSIDSLARLDYFVENETLLYPVANNGSHYSGIYLQRSYGGIGLVVNSTSKTNFDGKQATVILEYTKN